MRKGFKKLTSLLLLCTLLASIFSISGCTYGGSTTAYSVKESLIQAINTGNYDDYLNYAYPALRENIEADRKELGLSEENYMKHIKETLFPFEEDTLITQSSKIPGFEQKYSDTQLQLVADQFIYMDDYIELESATSNKFLIRDYRFSDDETTNFYLMEIVVVCADGHYYFSSYSIDKEPYDITVPLQPVTTTVDNGEDAE